MAVFEKGHKKLGGRKKGTSNKGYDIDAILAACAKYGKEPLDALAEMIAGHNQHYRFAASRELMKYLGKQLKAIEHSGEIESKPSVVVLHDGRKLVFKSDDET